MRIQHKRYISDNRKATAPYNFVPLPEKVYIPTEEDLYGTGSEAPRHDEYRPGLYRGYIDCILTTLTPLYTRGPRKKVQGDPENTWDETETRLRPEFFSFTPDGKPVIPGSSLRGMIRNLVEILSFSQVQPVSTLKPFYRSVGDDRLGRLYRDRTVTRGVKGGFFKEENGKRYIVPCDFARVAHSDLPEQIQNVLPRGPRPPMNWWSAQHSRCWVRNGHGTLLRRGEVQFQNNKPDRGWLPATLVLTGSAGMNRKKEFVFLDYASDASAAIEIPEAIWKRFHDEDQLTQWQEKAFPKDKPTKGCRRKDGWLRCGEPVFYITDEAYKSSENPGGLVFLGRAGLFRLPYDLTPDDLNLKISESELDLTERIFGYVGKGSKHDKCMRGGVRFHDAIFIGDPSEAYYEVIVPKILSSPKPTCFQHYLVQEYEQKDLLRTYLREDKSHTEIRGHKVYWHRWDDCSGLDQVTSNSYQDLLRKLQEDSRRSKNQKPKDTQHTLIQCVKEKSVFKFRVAFENLSDIELGALLSSLSLPKGCAHRLGMGKPLGLGSVIIEPRLFVIDNDKRYGAFGELGKQEKPELAASCREAFEKAIMCHVRQSNEPLADGEGLESIVRLRMLYEILGWENRRALKDTENLDINEFRDRRVLPLPWIPPEADRPSSGGQAVETPATFSDGSAHSPGSVVIEPAASKVEREWVVIVNTKGEKGTVRTEDGLEIPCSGFPYFVTGRKCRADVTRENDRPVKAVFKGWK